MSGRVESNVFLLPLSTAECASLIAAITIVLVSLETMAYTSPVQEAMLKAQKPNLESIKNKLSHRR